MERNELYPIFLKVNSLKVLFVGGRNVAEEKLTFLLKSSPNTKVEMVSPMYRKKTIVLAEKHDVRMHNGKYKRRFLKNKHIVVATTDIPKVNEKVYADCRKQAILVNVADTPPHFVIFIWVALLRKVMLKWPFLPMESPRPLLKGFDNFLKT